MVMNQGGKFWTGKKAWEAFNKGSFPNFLARPYTSLLGYSLHESIPGWGEGNCGKCVVVWLRMRRCG